MEGFPAPKPYQDWMRFVKLPGNAWPGNSERQVAVVRARLAVLDGFTRPAARHSNRGAPLPEKGCPVHHLICAAGPGAGSD